MAMLKIYGHILKLVKMSCGGKLMEVLFYVGVSRMNLLFFFMYAVKTHPGQNVKAVTKTVGYKLCKNEANFPVIYT